MESRDAILARIGQLASQGNFPGAQAIAEGTLSETPRWTVGWIMLGRLMAAQGNVAGAQAAFRKAAELEPHNSSPAECMVEILGQKGRFREAANVASQALERTPSENLARLLLLALGPLYDQKATLEAADRWSARYPDSAFLAMARLMTLCYPSDVREAEVYRAHRQHALRLERQTPKPSPHGNPRTVDRKLQIGYVSEYFKRHATAFFLPGILERHNRENVSVTLYSANQGNDDVTDKYRALADRFREISGASLAQLDRLIRDDKIDILVDLDGATSRIASQLFTQQPAPIQVGYLGYPFPVCLKHLHYRIVDGITDPAAAPAPEGTDYVEEPWRLDRHFLCYRPTSGLPPIKPLPPGDPVFSSFNNPKKISDECMALWAGALRAVPNSRLLLKYHGLDDPINVENLRKAFEELGINRERIEIRGPTATYLEHMHSYDEVHIALDTSPYNGTTTNYDAVTMGIPVVCIEGDSHRSRVTTSMLRYLGRDEWIAKTPEEFASIARDLVSDRAMLNGIRLGLRQELLESSLCDIEDHVRQVEGAYRAMWERYVDESA